MKKDERITSSKQSLRQKKKNERQKNIFSALVLTAIGCGVAIAISQRKSDRIAQSSQPNSSINSLQLAVEKITKINPERSKLEKRNRRWQNADKCLQSMGMENGLIVELCAEVKDIKGLADGDRSMARYVVDSHLETIKKIESAMNNGIINVLPKDEPMTFSAEIASINLKSKTMDILINTQYQKNLQCITRGETEGVNIAACQADANTEFLQLKKDCESSDFIRQSYLENFKKNYIVDP